MNDYAAKLLAYRRRHGLKQQVLADYLGVSQGTLSRWEAGVAAPTIGMGKRIEDLLNRDEATELEVIKRRVSASYTCALSMGRELIVIAHGSLIPMGDLIGKPTIHMIPELNRRHLLDNYEAILRGELIGSFSYGVWNTVPRFQGPRELPMHVKIQYHVIGLTVYFESTFGVIGDDFWRTLDYLPKVVSIPRDPPE